MLGAGGPPRFQFNKLASTPAHFNHTGNWYSLSDHAKFSNHYQTMRHVKRVVIRFLFYLISILDVELEN